MKAEKRFLITTALEETWVDDQPVLFLGEWCRLYSRKDRWSKMDGEVLPSHWDDGDKLHSDYLYLVALYERVLGCLSIQLNGIHGTAHNLRYWRILVGPWLAYFIQMLFDRWESIQAATSQYELSGTTIISNAGASVVPNDFEDFVQLFQSDRWNHYVYSCILETQKIFPESKVKSICCTEMSVQVAKRKQSLKSRLLSAYGSLVAGFSRNRDVFFSGTYLPFLKEVMLQLRFGQTPQIRRPVLMDPISVDWQARQWAAFGEAKSEFEEFVFSIVPKQIPVMYLEGYRSLREKIGKLSWPAAPKLIFSSNALLSDAVTMAYVAEKVTQGVPLVYGQHGGVYGVAKFSWVEEHEVAVADRYLTWGWSDSSRPSIVPLGVMKMPSPRKNSSKERNKLLLVTLEEPRYTYSLSSETMVMSSSYISNCFKFAAGLTSAIQGDLIVRLSGRDAGWNQFARWSDRFPSIRVDYGEKKISDVLKQTRLAVYTYNSTGFLEAFAANIPAVLFWDTRVSTLRDSAIPGYSELKQVGIFHETPDSAAAHVASIWGDVDAWWFSAPVQEVLARFKSSYCYTPADFLDRLEQRLKESTSMR